MTIHQKINTKGQYEAERKSIFSGLYYPGTDKSTRNERGERKQFENFIKQIKKRK